jgi:predicted patatin/cPLA2 family phospholipase
MVEIDGRAYLDGGVADSIPLARAIAGGCRKNVVVLTRQRGYQKPKNGLMPLIKWRYRRYPELVRAIATRHLRYNEALALAEAEQSAGRAFVIQPGVPVTISRLEKDQSKLRALYQNGYDDAGRAMGELKAFLAR